MKQNHFGGVSLIFKNMEKGRFYFCSNCRRRDANKYCLYAPHGAAADDRDSHYCIEKGIFILQE